MGFGRKTLFYVALPFLYLFFVGKSVTDAPDMVVENVYLYMGLPLVLHLWYLNAVRNDLLTQQKPYIWLFLVLFTGPVGAILYYVFVRDSQRGGPGLFTS